MTCSACRCWCRLWCWSPVSAEPVRITGRRNCMRFCCRCWSGRSSTKSCSRSSPPHHRESPAIRWIFSGTVSAPASAPCGGGFIINVSLPERRPALGFAWVLWSVQSKSRTVCMNIVDVLIIYDIMFRRAGLPGSVRVSD